jgi:xanthine/uracil permease
MRQHTRKFLDSLFPPFVETKRTKPRDMSYVAQETPDLGTTLAVGVTHTLSALMLVIYTVIVGREVGLSGAELRGFIALEVVVMGITTFLQSRTTRFSSGHLIVHSPSLMSMSAFIAAATHFGLGAAAGGLILSALVVIALSRLLPRLRTFFPPEVAGVLLVLLGLSLVEGGVRRFTGLAEGQLDDASVATALTTLVIIVGVSVWAGKRMRIFAVVFGVLAGLMVAVWTGTFGAAEMQLVAQQPLFAFPVGDFVPPTPTLVLAAALPLLLIQIIASLDSFGAGVAIDRLNDQKWRRADLSMISRLVSCHGIGVLLNGVTGTLPVGVSSGSLGLVAITGVAARKVGSVAGLMLITLAFFPQVSSFIVLIPLPVVGAIIVYTAGYMLVVGMELLLSRMLNSRRIFVVGLSLTIGASLLLMPELRASIPEDLQPVLASPLTMGGVAAIGLNLLFRIGISEQATIELSGAHAAHNATRFLEEQGALWGARPDVINRAGAAIGEALEALQGADMIQGPVGLKASFDEFSLRLILEYPGKAFALQTRKKLDLSSLLDEEGDAALDDAMARMSSHLIKGLADKVSSSEQSGRAVLNMQFSH